MRDEIQNNSMTTSSVTRKNTEDETQGSPGVDTAACCSGIRNQTAQFEHASDQHPAVVLTINGMHCGSCVGRVKTALTALDGVADVTADFKSSMSTIAGLYFTVALRAAMSTKASATPSSAVRAVSTLPTQDPQCMPLMVNAAAGC